MEQIEQHRLHGAAVSADPTAAEGLDVGELLTRLSGLDQRPEPFAAGTHPLWRDPHISRGMLTAHLDPSHDAASRRPATVDATVAWLVNQLPAGARVLDLGCGPGLYTERLAAAGFDVTGVDFSERSIEYARSTGSNVRYIEADYRELELDEHFDAVLMIYLDFAVLSPQDAQAVLRRVRGWTGAAGRFIFDVPTPAHRLGREQPRSWGVSAGGYWADEPHLWLSRTLRYGAVEPVYCDEHAVVTAGDVRIYRVWDQCYTVESLTDVCAQAGLEIASVYDDLTGVTFVPASSKTMGVIARPTVQAG